MPSLIFARLVRLCCGCLLVAATFSSCTTARYYRQRVMFQITDEKGNRLDTARLRTAVNRVAKNYLIQPNDYLAVHVYTNKGESILDPNGELKFGSGGGGKAGGGRSGGSDGAGSTANTSDFMVQADGTLVLPLVNRVKVAGLSLVQADSALRRSYNEYYKDPFVTTAVSNNRVVVLGAPGGRVIPLNNDNMNLLEVLALVGGVDGGGIGGANGSSIYRYGGRADRIRIIRGDLKSPQIQQIDLTTIDGMRRANLQVEPNDIIYIEPVRRPLFETLFDLSPVFSAASLVLSTTLIFVAYLGR